MMVFQVSALDSRTLFLFRVVVSSSRIRCRSREVVLNSLRWADPWPMVAVAVASPLASLPVWSLPEWKAWLHKWCKILPWCNSFRAWWVAAELQQPNHLHLKLVKCARSSQMHSSSPLSRTTQESLSISGHLAAHHACDSNLSLRLKQELTRTTELCSVLWKLTKLETLRWLSKWGPSPSSTLCLMASNTLCLWVPTKTNSPQHSARSKTFWVDQQATTWANNTSNSSLWTSCQLASLLQDRLIRWSNLSRTSPLPALLKSHQQPTWCSGSSLHLT